MGLRDDGALRGTHMYQHIRIMLILDSAMTIRGAAAIPWAY